MRRMIPLLTLAMLPGFGGELLAAKPAKVLIEEAKAARQEAADLGYEWLHTGKLITQAEAALAKGEETTASELASLALLEGQRAAEQGALMQAHWQEYIPRH